jgi:hypothetical protein
MLLQDAQNKAVAEGNTEEAGELEG